MHWKEEWCLKFVCGVVVKVRDEQDAIEDSLLSLLDQSLNCHWKSYDFEFLKINFEV